MLTHKEYQLFGDCDLARMGHDNDRFSTAAFGMLLFVVVATMLTSICYMHVFVTVSHAQEGKHVLFEDNFDNGLKPEWGRFQPFGEPGIENGKVVMTGKLEAALVGNSNTDWTDYVVEVDVAVEGFVPKGSSSFYQSPQIIFRASTPEDGWGDFYLVAFWDTRVHLYKRTGQDVEYTGMAGAFPDGVELGSKPIRVKIEVEGSFISVSVNGVECITYNDIRSPLTFGGAGIQSWQMPIGSKWVFDNFIIYQN